ncbi:hypothetical protein BHM03_00000764 [Ensete ventricosum]|nr:hypothetical protein BHM03_00000764 [Ensete ventricosum]
MSERSRDKENEGGRDKEREWDREKERDNSRLGRKERGQDREKERHRDRHRDYDRGRSTNDERGRDKFNERDRFQSLDNDRYRVVVARGSQSHFLPRGEKDRGDVRLTGPYRHTELSRSRFDLPVRTGVPSSSRYRAVCTVRTIR